MARVFISYVRNDHERASRIADQLKKQGVDLWWDPELRLGQRDLRTIDEQLAAAQSVLVLFSADSIRAGALLDEADYAREENKLVPVLLEDVILPPRFRRAPPVRLIENDPIQNAGWSDLVARLTGGVAMVDAGAGDRRKPGFISFGKVGGPALTTALMSISSVAAAAPATQFLFPSEAEQVLTQIANTAPVISGIAALMVLQQMWTRAKRG